MSSGTADQRWRRADRPAEERAEHCCAAMTFDEKVAVALGDFDAVAHLGAPPLRYRLERDDLAAFDEASGAWVVHQGRYEVLVGRSSRDIRGRAGFEVGARTPVGS
jgi:hypothetical protein